MNTQTLCLISYYVFKVLIFPFRLPDCLRIMSQSSFPAIPSALSVYFLMHDLLTVSGLLSASCSVTEVFVLLNENLCKTLHVPGYLPHCLILG